MRWFMIVFALTASIGIIIAPSESNATEYVVYSIYQGLNMGNPGEISQKDYYINMGIQQGIHKGSILLVMRQVPSYDIMNKQLYRDVVFPIALLKVIHVEPGASIARLDHLLPVENTPAITPRAVMVGDTVQIRKIE